MEKELSVSGTAVELDHEIAFSFLPKYSDTVYLGNIQLSAMKLTVCATLWVGLKLQYLAEMVKQKELVCNLSEESNMPPFDCRSCTP